MPLAFLVEVCCPTVGKASSSSMTGVDWSFTGVAAVDDVTGVALSLSSFGFSSGDLGSFCGEMSMRYVVLWRERNQRITPRWTPRSPTIVEKSKDRNEDVRPMDRLTVGHDIRPAKRKYGEHVHCVKPSKSAPLIGSQGVTRLTSPLQR